MSLCHIHFIKSTDSEDLVAFRLYSFDLNEDHEREEIGNIVIDKRNKSFKFIPYKPWKREKYYPPELWLLDDDERRRIASSDYSDHFGGRWSEAIAKVSREFITKEEYPEEHYHIS